MLFRSQRLAFARLLLIKPRFVFLDEATTALDRGIEQDLYQILPSIVEQYVSTGSASDLAEFHEHVLELRGDGTWSYR